MKQYTLEWNGAIYNSCPDLAKVTGYSPCYIRAKAYKYDVFEVSGHICKVTTCEVEKMKAARTEKKKYTCTDRGMETPMELVYRDGKLIHTIFL